MLLLAALAAFCEGCGFVSLGQGSLNDPTPTGTLVAQGTFTGQNGNSVSGTAEIYKQANADGTCAYVARLASLNAPGSTNLHVVPTVNGAPSIAPSSYTLRGSTGNQNYSFSSTPCNTGWAQVVLSDPTIQPPSAQTVGLATLTVVPGT